MNRNDPYLAYYRHQLGHGITSVYQGAPYQRGHGIGSFLGGLFRTITPLLKSGATALGKEALRHGIGFLGDIAGGTTLPREAAGARFKQFTDTLKRKADSKLDRVLSGGGIRKKRRVTRVTPQSLARHLSGRIKRPRALIVLKRRKKTKARRKTVKRRSRKTSSKKTRRKRPCKRRGRPRKLVTRDIFS